MGYGTVADEVKGRSPIGTERHGKVLTIEEDGVHVPLLHRRLRALHGARDLDGDPGRAELRPGAGLRRVHAVPRRPRLHRALDRAHASLARPLPGLARRERPARTSSSTGSCRAACSRTCASSRRRRSPPRARRHRDRRLARRRQGRRCTRWSAGRPRCCRRGPPAPPARASARSTTSCAASSSASTRSTARCRRGWAATAMALVPDPSNRWRVDLTKASWRDGDEPLMEGCPCAACAIGLTRGYLRYLAQPRS